VEALVKKVTERCMEISHWLVSRKLPSGAVSEFTDLWTQYLRQWSLSSNGWQVLSLKLELEDFFAEKYQDDYKFLLYIIYISVILVMGKLLDLSGKFCD
jgi:hypothetical protein